VSPPTESVTTEGAAAGNSLDLTALFAVALLVVGFTFSSAAALLIPERSFVGC